MRSVDEIRAEIVSMEVTLLDEPEEYNDTDQEVAFTALHDRLNGMYWVLGLDPGKDEDRIPVCVDCRKEIEDGEETMSRNDGRFSHLEECRPVVKWRVTVPVVGNCWVVVEARDEEEAVRLAQNMKPSDLSDLAGSVEFDESGMSAEVAP